MPSSMNVGELEATLGLADDLTPKLERAQRKFLDAGADMDVEATIGLDASGLDEGLDDAQKRSRRSGSEIGDEVADGVEESAPSMSSAGAGLGDVLVAGAIGVAAVGGALIVDEFSKALERDAGRMDVGASLLLPPEMSRELGRSSGEVWAQGWGESESEVGAAMRSYLVNIGGLGTMTEDEFEGMIIKGLQVADMLDQDVGATILTVGKMIRNGLVTDANEGFDLLARGASRVDATLHGELLETFDEYGANFRELGFTGPQAMGMVIASVNAGGRNIDLAADAMREFHDAMTDPASNAAARQAFTDLGLNADEMFARFRAGDGAGVLTETLAAMERLGDQGLRDQIGTDLFSIKWMDNGSEATAAMEPMLANLGDVGGSVDILSANVDTNAAKLEAWKRGAQTNVTDWIAEEGIPTLEEWGSDWENMTGTVGRFHDGLIGVGDGLRFIKDEGIDPIVGSIQDFIGKLDELQNNDAWKFITESVGGVAGAAGAADPSEWGSIFGGVGGALTGIFGDDGGGAAVSMAPTGGGASVGNGAAPVINGPTTINNINGYHRAPAAIADEIEHRHVMALAPAARL